MVGFELELLRTLAKSSSKKCADALEALTDKMSSLSTGLLEEQKT